MRPHGINHVPSLGKHKHAHLLVSAVSSLSYLFLLTVFAISLHSAAMLAKVYSNALMTSLNSRNSQGRPGDLEHGGATSQQYSTSSYTNVGRRTERSIHNPLSSFHTGPTAVTGGPTVVHISTATDREIDYTFEEDDMKTKDVGYPMQPVSKPSEY
jgi:hypothetical protein